MTRTYYKIKNFIRVSDEDIYSSGCTLDNSSAAWVEYEGREEKLDNLIKGVIDFLSIHNAECVLINSCGENGRIDFQVYETMRGKSATRRDMNLWKEGKLRLWLCTYSCNVTRITEETDFDLTENVKDISIYTRGD